MLFKPFACLMMISIEGVDSQSLKTIILYFVIAEFGVKSEVRPSGLLIRLFKVTAKPGGFAAHPFYSEELNVLIKIGLIWLYILPVMFCFRYYLEQRMLEYKLKCIRKGESR